MSSISNISSNLQNTSDLAKRTSKHKEQYHKEVISLIDTFVKDYQSTGTLNKNDLEYLEEVKAMRALHIRKLQQKE